MSTDTIADKIEKRAEDSAQRDATPKTSSSSKGSGSSSSSSGSSSSRSSSKRKRSGGRKSLRQPLTELLTTLGMGLSMVNAFDGQLIVLRAEDVARQLDDLARENPNVHKALSNLVTASAWGSVATVMASVLIPIGMNHGAVPANPLLVAAFVPDELAPLLAVPTPPEPDQSEPGA